MSTALAAPIGLQIQGLPLAPVRANGEHVSYVPVLITDEAGDALLGEVEVTATVELGEVLEVWGAAPGIYLLGYRPPTLLSPTLITLQVFASQGGNYGQGEVQVELLPSRGSIEARLEPLPFVLGTHTEGQLRFVARDASGNPMPSAGLHVRTSQGKVDGLIPTGDGAFSATFTAPEGRHPRVALITAVDPDAPDSTYGFLVAPLVGATTFPVKAMPGVKLEFKIAERSFGPFITNTDGVAQVSLEVPPGVATATVTSTDPDGKVLVEQLNLDPRPSRQLAIIAPPAGLPADGRTYAPVRVLVVDDTGTPRPGAAVTLIAAQGALTELIDEGGGLYRASYLPPVLTAATEDTLTATLVGADTLQTDTVTLQLLPADTAAPRAPEVQASEAQVDWLSLEVSREKIEPRLPAEVVVRVRGFGVGNAPVPLQPEMLLLTSRGRLNDRRNEEDGSISATLQLAPMAEGATVAVVAVDPIEGRATYALVYNGAGPTRSLAEVGEPSPADPPPAVPAEAVEPAAAPVVSAEAEPPTPMVPEEVRPAPPQTLQLRGTRMSLFYTAGSYTFSQSRTVADSAVLGGYALGSPTALGGGLGLDHWGTTRLGLSLRWTLGAFGFDAGERLAQSGYLLALKHVGTADLRWRYVFTPGSSAITLGLRLGAGAQNVPLFVEGDAGAVFTNERWIVLARGGVDFEAFIKGLVELGLSYDAGYAMPGTQLSTHHGDLTAAWRISQALSVGLGGEAWLRQQVPVSVTNEPAPGGNVSDQWFTGRVFLGMHF